MTLVADRRVVVTGKVPNHSRQTAEQALREAGAIVQSAVGKDTDILVTGAAVGATKINKAKALGVEIIPWEEAIGERPSGSSAPLPAAPRAPMPSVRQWAPMLCESADLPSGGNYVFEIKWDGVRGVATIKDGSVLILSRSGKTDLTDRYPQIAAELADLPNCVLDGEIATMVGDDSTVRFIAFDVMEVDGVEVTKEHLGWRRERLDDLVSGGIYIGASPVFTDGPELLAFVTDHGLEGIVAKKITSTYQEGARNYDWLKIKVRREQEFVVVGYTAGEGKRATTLGALILGYWDKDGEIVYAGKVGTGWDDDELEMLSARTSLFLTGSPDDYYESSRFPSDILREGFFLEPELVVQVAYQKWTDDGLLWHPSYQGLREDKSASEVVREYTL